MIEQLPASEFSAWLRRHAPSGTSSEMRAGTPVVLDVREPWELQTASVKAQGFELVAIPMREVPARLAELDAGRPIACLCHHGMRSQQVANYLQQQGFTQVVNLAGGIDAWSSAIDPDVPRY
jgi:rhodanese-related sulfurtransferase